MAIQMTRKEYEEKYGVKPVFLKESDLDIQSAPIRMTRAEYDAKYRPEDITNRGLFGPAKDAIQGLKTTYGGGEQGIANKLLSDVKSGVTDIQTGMETGGIKGVPSALKGMVKSGGRIAGDIVGTVYAPIGATLQAFGANKLFDYIGEVSQKGKYNPINVATDVPSVQNFVMTHPNASEDFNRAMNLAFAKAETGKIEPKTAMPRTIEQVKTGVETIKNVPQKIKTYQESKASQNIADEIFNIENNYVKLQKNNTFEYDNGKASRERIAQTDVLSKIVNEDGKISIPSAKLAAKEYLKQTVDGSEGVVRKLLINEGKKVNIAEVAKVLTEKVYGSGLEGSALIKAVKGIKAELDGLRLRADDLSMIDLSKLHDAKISESQNINYKTDSTPTIKYKKAKASAYKEIVENRSKVKVADKYTISDINRELGKYLSDAERIENLGGKGVKGSKLGKYTAQISGQLIGATTGAAIAGPAGMAIATVLGGEAAGFIKGKQMASTFGKARGTKAEKSALLEKAKTEGNIPQGTNLKISDPIVGVPKEIPKTKDILKSENLIRKNVEQQRSAIKAGNFELVATLKEIYQVLIENLKDLVRTVKKDYSNNLGNRKTQYNKTKIANNTAIPKTLQGSEKKSMPIINKDNIITNPNKEGNVIVALKSNEKFPEVMMELEALTDIAEAGSRNFTGYGNDFQVTANKSTFPKWIPEDLRSKALMEKTLKTIMEGELPKKNATKEQRLYNEFVDYIEQRLSTPEDLSLKSVAEQSGIFSKIKKFLGEDLPNKQGGFVQIGKKTVKEIDELTKDQLWESIKLLKGEKSKVTEADWTKLAEKFEIGENQPIPKIIKRIETILEKTKTKSVLPKSKVNESVSSLNNTLKPEIKQILSGKKPVYRAGNQSDKLSKDDVFGNVKYFADRKNMAEMYGSNVKESFVTIKKPYVISEKSEILGGKNEDHIKIVREMGGTDKFRKYLKENGYDGIIVEKDYGNEILVLDKNQIKSSLNDTTLLKEAKGKSLDEFIKSQSNKGNVGTSFGGSNIFEKLPEKYVKSNIQGTSLKSADDFLDNGFNLENGGWAKASNFENAEGFRMKPKIFKKGEDKFAFLSKPFEKLTTTEQYNLTGFAVTENGGKSFFKVEPEIVGTGKTKSQLEQIWKEANKK